LDQNLDGWAEVDEQGRIVLSPELAARYGLAPGARLRIEKKDHHLRLHRPATHLVKVDIEPTNLCNLNCSICIRNSWDEPPGRMDQRTFDRILAGVKGFSPQPSIFFGGWGEPLSHPKIVDWVAGASAAGSYVELITNGTLLTEKCAKELIEAGLDRLWVSIDGASSESYTDVRLGDELPLVLENLSRFRHLRRGGHHPKPEIGIAFVALKRNIADLPKIIQMGRRLGAKYFSVTNVMPYTAEMQAESLYKRTLRTITYMDSNWLPRLNLPKMDLDESTREAFLEALTSGCNVQFAGSSLSASNDVCTFIDKGTTSLAWDGSLSPCWPLMHHHTSYLHGKQHHQRRHVVGNINDHDLKTLWMEPDYLLYREKVQSFAFAPCTYCGGCDLSEANEEDCIGNSFPACGCCLWSQGIIQCP
jgi:MoaA/NifB/PqqE/SkfB family radical SAM enzyme